MDMEMFHDLNGKTWRNHLSEQDCPLPSIAIFVWRIVPLFLFQGIGFPSLNRLNLLVQSGTCTGLILSCLWQPLENERFDLSRLPQKDCVPIGRNGFVTRILRMKTWIGFPNSKDFVGRNREHIVCGSGW